jgi:hypothetical protein
LQLSGFLHNLNHDHDLNYDHAMYRIAATHTLRGLRTSAALRAANPKGALEQPPAPSAQLSDVNESPEKTPDTPTYVQSSTPPSERGYAVPPGAFPSAAPYAHFPAAARPGVLDRPLASAAPDRAHPVLTAKVPTNESGVHVDGGIGASSAVRFRDAPGTENAAMGGGAGGAGIQDPQGTKPGVQGELPDVNDVPVYENTERTARKGVKEGWTDRK